MVLEEGSPNAHVAIIARALDVPVVGQVREALQRIDPGDVLIVDAEHAQVLVRPSEDMRADVPAQRRRAPAAQAAVCGGTATCRR